MQLRLLLKKQDFQLIVQYEGVFVMMVLEEGAADGILEAGDKIRAVDGVPIEESGQFYKFMVREKNRR